MTAFRFVTLLCDYCEDAESRISARTAAETREQSARLDGWRFIRGKDVCPSCAAPSVGAP